MQSLVILFLLNCSSLSSCFTMTYGGSYQTTELCEQGFRDINTDLDIFRGLDHKCVTVQTMLETEEDQE